MSYSPENTRCRYQHSTIQRLEGCMHGFRWAWCSVLALALPASLALPTKAQTQTSHSQKTFVSRAAQQEASSSGAVAGVPWTGSPGITQTVEEIMARQRLLDAQPQAKLPPHPTK